MTDTSPNVEPYVTDVCIIGTGPAGGALASFLGHYGVKGIVISKTNSTAVSPRAHITNVATLECLRDIGLEDEARQTGLDKSLMKYCHWCESMSGRELARVFSWGNGPLSEGEYKAASPCEPLDLAQTLLEPILYRKAVSCGIIFKFNTSFVSFAQDTDKGVVVKVKDTIFGTEHLIKCKFLFGADGARSSVLTQLGLPLQSGDGQGVNVVNLLIKADLSKHMKHRGGNLHWTFQEDHVNKGLVWVVHPRMVTPWSEWVVGFFVAPGSEHKSEIPATREDWAIRVRKFIGDDSIPFEIVDISPWQLNNTIALEYSRGRVFCLGDAVHRHTPGGGLGSNTSIQDAYNLAWKVAYVLRGKASPELLETYSPERQPVGAHVTKSAMGAVTCHAAIWQSFGINTPNLSGLQNQISKLSTASEQGRKARADLRTALENTCYELKGIGIELNQRYASSAVYLVDEGEPPELEEPRLRYYKSTYPGSRLPHAWLNTAIPAAPISTIDIAGNGRFTLFTGIGGGDWKKATKEVSAILGIEIPAYSIGFGQDYEDPHFQWEDNRGVEESGCVLIRPDRFVAWRCQRVTTDCVSKLTHVLKSILSIRGSGKAIARSA